MATCIAAFTSGQMCPVDPLRFRVLLFRELHQQRRLGEEEKVLARNTAMNHLVDHLRATPYPPIRLRTDKEVRKNWGKIQECIETAYSLRPRPSAELLLQLAVFTGSSGNTTTSLLTM
jgi:hypothetical protein